MINPNQQQQVSQFQNLNRQEQAEKIASMCNQYGITFEQLKNIYNGLK